MLLGVSLSVLSFVNLSFDDPPDLSFGSLLVGFLKVDLYSLDVLLGLNPKFLSSLFISYLGFSTLSFLGYSKIFLGLACPFSDIDLVFSGF